MAKFEQYNISLKGIKTESHRIEFTLDDNYFKKIDSPEVQHGKVNAIVSVQKRGNIYELAFDLNGIIQIPCNRCLDNMDQPIQYKDKLQVKMGDKFAEEGDIVIIPESDGAINIAWFLYEFIVLNIPIKHIHQPGECNKTMVSKLRKHITHQKSADDDMDDIDIDFDDDDEHSIHEVNTDPRWDGLQNIFENN